MAVRPVWIAAVAVPAAAFVALLARPNVDKIWESHPAHFWTVLTAAGASVAVGWAVSSAGRRRRDARLFLVSLACLASAGFLGLHALATPGVLLGKNAGFELATPVGLVIASAFAALSAVEFGPLGASRILRIAPFALSAVGVLFVAWGVVSLAKLPPLDAPLVQEQLDGWQLTLAGVGIAFYSLAAFGYLRLYRRRNARFVIAVTVAFALLAEAMIVIAWARNWHASWWEWHLLMLASFLLIAETARTEWHEERFSALYLDQTLAGARDVSVLLADLSGFTSFSERHDPQDVTAMLNAYFGAIVPLMKDERGEVAPDRRRRADGDLQQAGRHARSSAAGRARGADARTHRGSGRSGGLAALPRRRQQRDGGRRGRRRRDRSSQARRRRRHRERRRASRGRRGAGDGGDRSRDAVPPTAGHGH